MGWVGTEGVDINWNVSPVSSAVTVLSHRGEFDKTVKTGNLLLVISKLIGFQ